jgi:hypothetical protein
MRPIAASQYSARRLRSVRPRSPHLHRPGFAVQEILVVFATILPVFRFVLLDPPAVMPEARITLRPAGGMKMIVMPR